MLRAQGEAEAIDTVFNAIHLGDPDPKLLAYQYLQTLPKLAEGSANKLWIIPSELTEALKGIGSGFFAPKDPAAPGWVDRGTTKVSDTEQTPDLATTVDLGSEPDLGFPTVTRPGVGDLPGSAGTTGMTGSSDGSTDVPPAAPPAAP